MFWDDLRRLLSGRALYRLDTLIGERLVPVLYALGLAAIGLWAIDHLFASFAFNFGQGLWGILEILVFGPLWVVALRLSCELVLVFFKAHAGAAAAVNRGRARNTLLEDVGAAIHDLAEDEADDDIFSSDDGAPPAPQTGHPVDVDPIIKGTVPRRTARRTPRPKPPEEA
jgi:hypothetical protein